MKKTITIGNQTFTVEGTTTGSKSFYGGASYDEIERVYRKPSSYKVDIWHDWCKWAYDYDAMLEISGHNCNFFSISGKVINPSDGKVYALWITYANNRAYEIVDNSEEFEIA